MSYFVKGLVQNEYEQKFAGLNDFVVLETKGVAGNDNNAMRGDLLSKGIRLTVVKNSLMRRALSELGHEDASALFETGPCTIAIGGDSIVDVAKEISDWAKKIKVIRLKGAFVEGTVLDAEGAKELSKMPTRAELQAQVVQLVLSPGSQLAGSIAGAGSRIAGCLKSLIEKLEKEAA